MCAQNHSPRYTTRHSVENGIKGSWKGHVSLTNPDSHVQKLSRVSGPEDHPFIIRATDGRNPFEFDLLLLLLRFPSEFTFHALFESFSVARGSLRRRTRSGTNKKHNLHIGVMFSYLSLVLFTQNVKAFCVPIGSCCG